VNLNMVTAGAASLWAATAAARPSATAACVADGRLALNILRGASAGTSQSLLLASLLLPQASGLSLLICFLPRLAAFDSSDISKGAERQTMQVVPFITCACKLVFYPQHFHLHTPTSCSCSYIYHRHRLLHLLPPPPSPRSGRFARMPRSRPHCGISILRCGITRLTIRGVPSRVTLRHTSSTTIAVLAFSQIEAEIVF
jgi:hypothetical protein